MELARMTWPDVRDAIEQCGIGLLPVGAIEQHGPHLPLNTDWAIASHIARTVSEAEDLLLLPGFEVGVSHEHRQFWGTLTISPDALRDQAIGMARSAGGHGLRRIVFVNGHGSNCAPLSEAARTLRDDGIFAFVFNWWESISAVLADLFPDPTAHAGSIETSLMMAIDPDAVRRDRFDDADAAVHWGTRVEGVLTGLDAADFTEMGNVGDPRRADAEKGEAVLAASCASLARFCRWLKTQEDGDLVPRPHKA